MFCGDAAACGMASRLSIVVGHLVQVGRFAGWLRASFKVTWPPQNRPAGHRVTLSQRQGVSWCMRIGELANLVGISTRAIRHYHHVGLLAEPARKANGYREYSLRDAVELARVRRLAELGLSLDEVGDALAGDVPGPRRDPPRARRRPGPPGGRLRRAGPGWPSCCGKPRQVANSPGRRLSLRASRAVRSHGPRRRGRPGPEPAMAAKDRDLMALLETASPARGARWLAVLTQTLNSDPGPPKGPTPSTPASTSWPARPRMTPGSRRRPRPSSRPSRSRHGRRSGSPTATLRKRVRVSPRPSTRTSPRPRPPRSAAPST